MIKERRGIIQSAVTAIATKPFLLLAGISGSGKTQLARRIAAGIAAGTIEDGLYTGKMVGNKLNGDALSAALVQNGIVPELAGDDGDEYVEIRELFPAAENRDAMRNMRNVLKNRVAFLPVRPDWNDSRQLWGHYNPLTGLYYPTDALQVTLHAYLEYIMFGDAAPRHFLILDELNLARVEYYLSDLLSLMETPCVQVDPNDVRKGIRMGELAQIHPFSRPLWAKSAPQMDLGIETSSHERIYIGRLDEGWGLAYSYLGLGHAGTVAPPVEIDIDKLFHGADWARLVPQRIAFTPNLTIIGTVNVDETTHSFAPKVLDRSFVLEFNEVDYAAVCHDWPHYPEIATELDTLYAILRPATLHFGYRVVHEMVGFLGNTTGGWDVHGDFLLVSKVLPKLRGGEDKLGPILAPLLVYAITGSNDVRKLNGLAAQTIVDLADGAPLAALIRKLECETPRYPQSADKIYRMTRQLLDSGLASFF